MLMRLVISALMIVMSRGLSVPPTKPQSRPQKAAVEAVKSSFFAAVCLMQCASPVVAIDAGSYSDLYDSSSMNSQPGFSFSLPGKSDPIKKRQEAPPPTKSLTIPEVPKVDLPKVDVPSFSVPKVDVPSFSAPSFSVPKVDVPSFTTPKVDVPSFTPPKVDVPSFTPPKVDVPELPSLPSIPFFGGGGEKKAEVVVDDGYIDKDAIDAEARATASDFRDADRAAKDVEEQGRKLRKFANEKKKIAKVAKDAACEYRPGGKWICLRGFNSGF